MDSSEVKKENRLDYLFWPVPDPSDPAVEDGRLAEYGGHVARVTSDVSRLRPGLRVSVRPWGHGPDVVYFVHQLLSRPRRSRVATCVVNLIQLETSAAVQLGRKSWEKGKLKVRVVKHTLRAVHLSKWGFRIVWELLFVRPWKEKEVCEPSIKVCFAFLTQNIQKFNFWRTDINALKAIQRPRIVLLYWLLLCPTSRGTL